MVDEDSLRKKLIELQETFRVEVVYDCVSIKIFWCPLLEAFSGLAQTAMNKLLQFPSTYLCEGVFSILV